MVTFTRTFNFILNLFVLFFLASTVFYFLKIKIFENSHLNINFETKTLLAMVVLFLSNGLYFLTFHFISSDLNNDLLQKHSNEIIELKKEIAYLKECV